LPPSLSDSVLAVADLLIWKKTAILPKFHMPKHLQDSNFCNHELIRLPMGPSHWEAQVRYFEEFLIHGEPQMPIKLSNVYGRYFEIEVEV
jgi:hypothetical protein